jgi:hypothetical protein
MLIMPIHCTCINTSRPSHADALNVLGSLRLQCPALRQILIPDSIWDEYQAAARYEDAAAHCPMIILSLIDGHLSNITIPIHIMLFNGVDLSSCISKQYKKDLAEKWFFERGVMRRHGRSRRFVGKLVEILYAAHLNHSGWRIINLEAWDGERDIEAIAPDNQVCAFELKYIGQDDTAFKRIVESMIYGPTVHNSSIYSAANYLIYRVYEAARQLREYPHRRIATIVLAKWASDRIDLTIEDNWIDWMNAKFFDEADAEWGAFLMKQKTRNPSLEDDMAETIRSLNSIWIEHISGSFEYGERKEIVINI